MKMRLIGFSGALVGAAWFAGCSSGTSTNMGNVGGSQGIAGMSPVAGAGGGTAAGSGGMAPTPVAGSGGMAPTPVAGSGGMAPVAGSGGMAPMAGSGGMPPMPPACATVPATPVTALPMAVFDSPFGLALMGRSINDGGASTLAVATGGCPTHHADAAAGATCVTMTWTPVIPVGGTGDWAGAVWQTPNDNWGDGPLLNVAAGATALEFYAWGAVGGEPVTVLVGGLSSMMTGCGEDHATIQQALTLTTEPQLFSIDISAMNYSAGVVSSVRFVTETTTIPTDVVSGGDAGVDVEAGEYVFFVDDAHWVAE